MSNHPLNVGDRVVYVGKAYILPERSRKCGVGRSDTGVVVEYNSGLINVDFGGTFLGEPDVPLCCYPYELEHVEE